MAWVLAVGLVGFVVFLVFGSITGHVKVTSCCGVPDPRCDARMRDAFLDAPNHPTVACHPTVDEMSLAESAPGSGPRCHTLWRPDHRVVRLAP